MLNEYLTPGQKGIIFAISAGVLVLAEGLRQFNMNLPEILQLPLGPFTILLVPVVLTGIGVYLYWNKMI